LVEELEKPYPHVAEGLLCKGWREATNRGAVWYAIHVETPQQSLQKISTGNFRALLDNVNLATDLEAELVRLKSSDVIEAILEFAREKAISKIILKRSRHGFWGKLYHHSIPNRLFHKARDVDVEFVRDDLISIKR
jgi:two-component system, OmpR family, sensor histidine kinase KdpD